MPYRLETHLQRTRPGRRDADRQYEQRRSSDPALARSKRFRDSARWQRFRAWFRRRHPLCCDPFRHHAEDGVVVATAHVHHIVSLTSDEGMACTESNCAPVCTQCHAKVEGLERAGKPTQHLFAAFIQTLESDKL